MMNTAQLDSNALRLRVDREESVGKQMENLLINGAKLGAPPSVNSKPVAASNIYKLLESLDVSNRRRTAMESVSRAERSLSDAKIFSQTFTAQGEYINRHYFEWHRKFTLSVACIVLFFVGAPFGSIVRKGGLGLPLVASVLFFVLYYVVGMIAEKAVREGAIGPWGMWISTFVMLPLGICLSWLAVRR